MMRSLVITGVSWMGGLSLFMIALQMSKIVILARLLSPDEFGEMAVLMLVIGFAGAISDMGLGVAIVQYKQMSKQEFSSVYWTGLFVSVFCFLLVNFAGLPLSSMYSIDFFQYKLLVLSSCIFVKTLSIPYQFCFQKVMNFKMISTITMASEFGGFLTVLVLAFYDYGVWSLILGQFITSLIFSIIMFSFGSRFFYRPAMVLKVSQISQLLSFGIYQSAERIVNFASASADKFLISRFLGMEQLGIYNVFWQTIMLPINKINPIANSIAYPTFSKIKSNKMELLNSYIINVKILSCISVPILLFMYFFAEQLVDVVLGSQWSEYFHIFQILSILGISKVFANPGGALFLSIGRADIGFWWNLGWALSTALSLYVVFIFSPSLISVSLTLVFLSLTVGLIWHYLLYKVAGVDYKKIFPFIIRIVLVSVVILNLVDFIISNLFFEPGLLSVFSCVIAYGVFGLLYLFIFERELRKIVLG